MRIPAPAGPATAARPAAPGFRMPHHAPCPRTFARSHCRSGSDFGCSSRAGTSRRRRANPAARARSRSRSGRAAARRQGGTRVAGSLLTGCPRPLHRRRLRVIPRQGNRASTDQDPRRQPHLGDAGDCHERVGAAAGRSLFPGTPGAVLPGEPKRDLKERDVDADWSTRSEPGSGVSQLRRLAVDGDTTVRPLPGEALNDLFAKHGLPELVEMA